MMVIMQVFEFIYTDSIYESAMATLSLHRTKQGAYKAMRNFLINGHNDWYDERIMYGKFKNLSDEADKFGTHCAWAVRSQELKE